MEPYENEFNISDIKLIIWDLDDTFWNGTISANNETIALNKKNIKLIETLIEHGIMCSICSMNDFDTIKNVFKKPELNHIWSYFVFPSVDWSAKGNRIKDIIEKMHLREQNVLFIDDNIANLEEAKSVCPKIQTMTPDNIPQIEEQSKFLTKDDSSHSRLKQYKILEQKNKERKKYSSNEKFLYSSNIQVEIKSDCQNVIERITELINRTNQLNYTKIRLNQEEVQDLLQNENIENRYIKVKDAYGDYGICGFYSMDKISNKIIHFLFSCRVMSLGIEQYVYSKLNFPDFEINGSTATPLLKNKYCNWINNDLKTDKKSGFQKNKIKNDYRVLLKGACDMYSVVSLLFSGNNEFKINRDNFITELDHYDERGLRAYNSLRLVNIVNSHKLPEATKKMILDDAEFLTKEVYDQSIFDKYYDVIIFSLLTDTRSKIYMHNKTQEIISWDDYPNFTDENNKDFYQNNKKWSNFEYNKPNDIWTDDKIKQYGRDFKYLGCMEPEELIKYLDYMIENTSKTTKWIFIIGSDVKPKESLYSSPYWRQVYDIRKKQNKIYRKFLKNKTNTTYIDLSKIVVSGNDTTDELDHFSRLVYYKLSLAIAKKINETLNTNAISSNFSPMLNIKLFFDKIYKFFNRFIPKFGLFEKFLKLFRIIKLFLITK